MSYFVLALSQSIITIRAWKLLPRSKQPLFGLVHFIYDPEWKVLPEYLGIKVLDSADLCQVMADNHQHLQRDAALITDLV